MQFLRASSNILRKENIYAKINGTGVKASSEIALKDFLCARFLF